MRIFVNTLVHAYSTSLVQTIVGAFLDPVADKVFIGSVAVGLTMQGLLPAALTTIFIGRDVIIIVAGLVLRSIEKPKDAGFFDVKSTAIQVAPSMLSKVLRYSSFQVS